jgi:hypothetical protein
MLKYELVKQIPVIDPMIGPTTLSFDTASKTGITAPINPVYIGASGAHQVYAKGIKAFNPSAQITLPPQQQIAVMVNLGVFERSEQNVMLDVSGTCAITTTEESSADDITVLPVIGDNWTYTSDNQVNYHLLPSAQVGDHNVGTYSSQVLLADINAGGVNLARGYGFGFVIRNNAPIASSESNRDIETIDCSLFARYCLDGYKIQGAF